LEPFDFIARLIALVPRERFKLTLIQWEFAPSSDQDLFCEMASENNN